MQNYLPFVFFLGCSPNFNQKGSVNTQTVNGSNSENSLEASLGLDSLMDEMMPEYCENIQPDVAGATSYFYGVYLREGGSWEGEEQWILHPTSSWTSTNGDTCFVTWAIRAEEQETAGCPDCDFALLVNGSLNRERTDCPEGLWENEEQWSTTYNIKLSDTESTVYFQSDGAPVGTGYATNNAFNFLSEVSCSWF
jgi:hypothetical protein